MLDDFENILNLVYGETERRIYLIDVIRFCDFLLLTVRCVSSLKSS